MAAPDTNVDKQTKRHKGPLIGFTIGAIFVLVMILLWAGGDAITEDDAQDGVEGSEAALTSPGTDTVDTMAEDAAQGELVEDGAMNSDAMAGEDAMTTDDGADAGTIAPAGDESVLSGAVSATASDNNSLTGDTEAMAEEGTPESEDADMGN